LGRRADRIDLGTEGSLSFSEGLHLKLFVFILEDREGALWIGAGEHGLNRFRNGRLMSYTTKDGLSDNDVRSILERRDGSLWFGSNDGGLTVFKEEKFTVLGDVRENLARSSVKCFYEGRDGSLWIGTEDADWASTRTENFEPLPLMACLLILRWRSMRIR
jgi:ligand-binding sensor domain-containing protein